MKKRTAITLEQHRFLALSVHNIKDSIHTLHTFLLDKESSGPEIVQLRSMGERLDSLRSKLDNKYHALIDDETFKKFGHIYYSRGEQNETTR